MPKNRRGALWGFSTSILVAKHQKIEGETLWGKNFEKKVSQCRKKLEGGSFGVARYGMLREKQEKPFWFSQFARPNGAI